MPSREVRRFMRKSLILRYLFFEEHPNILSTFLIFWIAISLIGTNTIHTFEFRPLGLFKGRRQKSKFFFRNKSFINCAFKSLSFASINDILRQQVPFPVLNVLPKLPISFISEMFSQLWDSRFIQQTCKHPLTRQGLITLNKWDLLKHLRKHI